ncbi:hypothetical protein [uncultured Endozoicomonas sp.]|uniref:hypothetical protein n=1 Tax=uncultured Endozoicomonas sp. TaxID=432652 RepID=UPI002616C20C|nr:hypothetical protein [uncultured Endozoicomonas sp.]
MLPRITIFIAYLLHCLRLKAKPWHFFKINAAYFNDDKGLFSKQDINQLIPSRWRLHQEPDNGVSKPTRFPVFVKPEWGQNATGVCRVDNQHQLEQIRLNKKHQPIPYLIQESAAGHREFELYLIRSDESVDQFLTLSITEVINTSGDALPVNSAYSAHTFYIDLSSQFSSKQLDELWQHLKTISQFKMARFGIRADSIENLLEGNFKIFEINLLLPMPLALLSENIEIPGKLALACLFAKHLAQVTKTLPEKKSQKSIFFQTFFGKKGNLTLQNENVAL